MKKNPGRKERRTRNQRQQRDPGSIEDAVLWAKGATDEKGRRLGKRGVNTSTTKDKRGNLFPRGGTAFRPGRSRSNRLGLPQYSAGLFR